VNVSEADNELTSVFIVGVLRVLVPDFDLVSQEGDGSYDFFINPDDV